MDSSGALKYDDFNLARLEGENLDELFEMSLAEATQTSDQTKQDDEIGSKSTLGKHQSRHLAPLNSITFHYIHNTELHGVYECDFHFS